MSHCAKPWIASLLTDADEIPGLMYAALQEGV